MGFTRFSLGIGAAALAIVSACAENPTGIQLTTQEAQLNHSLLPSPASCVEVKTVQPTAVDGHYTIVPSTGPAAGKGFTVWCADMSTVPAEYLTLINTGPGRNYTLLPPNRTTSFTRLRLNPATLEVDVVDTRFATATTGSPNRYASTGGCGWQNSTANIDLVGTQFSVDDIFYVDGYYGNGSVNDVKIYSVFAPTPIPGSGQVIDLWGTGDCGGINTDPYLQLVFVGVSDQDGDGVGDDADAFPHDPSETTDSDGDGVGNNADLFPSDPNETADSDGDGAGDNGDAFPNDAAESADRDNDGVGDNADAFPFDGNETVDSDGDDVGDNGDAFPNDAAETMDSDGDGVGDNADPFPNSSSDPTVDIGGTDSGVSNQTLASGATFSDLIAAARASAANRGAFLSAVTTLTNSWKNAGLISGRDQGAITSAAARSR